MNLFVDANDVALLSERVFFHPYYRHVLLFYARQRSVKSFTLVFKDGVCEKIKYEILNDAWLRGIEVAFRTAADGTRGSSILNAPYGDGLFFRLRRKPDFKEFRKKIAGQIRSSALTPVAKHVNKRLSLPLSSLLARTNLSPNRITVFAFLFSIAGAICFFSPRFFPFGFACFQINSILDGTDGEVARMNFRCSAFGKKLDVYCDYLTSVLLTVGAFTGYAVLNPERGIVAGAVLGMFFLSVIGGVWIFAVKKGDTPENFDDVEAICHARLKRPQTRAESVLSGFLFISHRDFYILTAFLLSLAGWFAAIHVFLLIVCASWLALSLHTLTVCVELRGTRAGSLPAADFNGHLGLASPRSQTEGDVSEF